MDLYRKCVERFGQTSGSWTHFFAVATVLFLFPGPVAAQSLVVQPYLQLAQPESIVIMWETDEDDSSLVLWGPTEQLGSTATGDSVEGSGDSRVHTVELSGLVPNTRYYYRTDGDSDDSSIYSFITPALASAEASFRMVAMSDMQRDGSNPDKFEEVVHDGVLDFVQKEYGEDLPAELAFNLIPGDLVVTGSTYSQWAEHFFAPAHPLFAEVPVYPVPGNHEYDSPNFFRYFHLPDNGTEGYEEHWWYHRYSNVLLIGLDSNSSYRIQEQLDWLEATLDSHCSDSEIDFAFAQLHHPHKSELWTPGETSFTGDVIELLESFTEDCSKPSIHFFGHTHGYSRGQSRDHEHLWVNVATAGGAIDHWDEFPQADYAEFSVSQDDWGFVLLEVEAGADPQFTLRRVSRGNETTARDNEIRDDVTVRLNNEAPATPSALSPKGSGANPDAPLLVASFFSDIDGDLHGASHFQIAETCKDFESPLWESWLQHENQYYGTDTQDGDDLSDALASPLQANASYCWRIRYRDRSLAWSDWSKGAAFQTSASALSDNLLQNPGAEDGLTHWESAEGTFESLGDEECSSPAPYSGEKLFAVGGVCENEADYGEAFQSVDLTQFAKPIDAGAASVLATGRMRNYSGSDQPTFFLRFFEQLDADHGQDGLSQSETASGATGTWMEFSLATSVPATTRRVDFTLTGTRKAGTDNDSYFDALSLRIDTGGEVGGDDDDDSSTGDDDDSSSGDDDDTSDGDDDDNSGDQNGSEGPGGIVGTGGCPGCGIEQTIEGKHPSLPAIGLALAFGILTQRRRRQP